jgi:hypothetical protein
VVSKRVVRGEGCATAVCSCWLSYREEWEGSRGNGSEEQPNKQAQDQHQCTTTTTTTEEEEARHSHSQYVLAEASAAQVYQCSCVDCEWCGVEGYLYQLELSSAFRPQLMRAWISGWMHAHLILITRLHYSIITITKTKTIFLYGFVFLRSTAKCNIACSSHSSGPPSIP